MKAKDKSAYRTLRLAMDIYRRILKLQADWVAFDPFGAVVDELIWFSDNGAELRKSVLYSIEDWDWNLDDEILKIRPIALNLTGYALFKAQIKGIEGALRRFVKEPYTKGKEHIASVVEAIRYDIANLKLQM